MGIKTTGKLELGNFEMQEDYTDNDGLEINGTIHLHGFEEGISGNICIHEGTEPTVSSSGGGHRIWADSNHNLLWQNHLGVSVQISSTTDYADRIVSANGDGLIITDTELNYKDRLVIDETKLYEYSLDGLKWTQMSDTSWRYWDGNGWRMVVNSTEYAIKSPSLLNEVIVDDDMVRLKIGADRFDMTSSGVTYKGSTIQTASFKGVANGIAELDASGIVPTSQLPGYVDAIVEYDSLSALETADPQESNKLYITIDDNKIFRYTGTAGSYGEISSTIVLGTTNTTAYRGDRGLIAYDHSLLVQEHIDWTVASNNLSTSGTISATGGGQTGKFQTGGAGATVFSFTGGSFDIRAGSGTSSSQTTLKITSAGVLTFDDLTRDRLSINAANSLVTSPNGTEILLVDNTGAFYNGVEIATVDDIQAGDGWTDKIQSEDDTLTITNSGLVHFDGLINRMVIDTTQNHMIGPFGTHETQLTALGFFYDGVQIATVDDLHDQIDSHQIISADGLKDLILTNNSLNYFNGTRNILEITNVHTKLYSNDGTNSVMVDNDGVVLQGGTLIDTSLMVTGSSYLFGLEVNGNTSLGSTEIKSDGEALILQASTTGQKAIHSYRKSDGTRMGWVGFGSSGDYRMGIYNDNANANIELTCTGTGQVNINAPIKAESYKSSDGSVGVTTNIAVPGYVIVIKNGLITQVV